MISTAELRKVLGTYADNLSDLDIERLRGLLYLHAELTVKSAEREIQEKAA